MLYYTQLIFIKEGQQEFFHQFEDLVLPLLPKHGGELLLRLRPDKNSYIGNNSISPYEVHLVSFPSKDSFEFYLNDPERAKYISLKNQSIEKVVLIEGVSL
jgi:uncharacterized protein (DUF1330 family)